VSWVKVKLNKQGSAARIEGCRRRHRAHDRGLHMTGPVTEVYVAAGSNVDPLRNLQHALRELNQPLSMRVRARLSQWGVVSKATTSSIWCSAFTTPDSVEASDRASARGRSRHAASSRCSQVGAADHGSRFALYDDLIRDVPGLKGPLAPHSSLT